MEYILRTPYSVFPPGVPPRVYSHLYSAHHWCAGSVQAVFFQKLAHLWQPRVRVTQTSRQACSHAHDAFSLTEYLGKQAPAIGNHSWNSTDMFAKSKSHEQEPILYQSPHLQLSLTPVHVVSLHRACCFTIPPPQPRTTLLLTLGGS